VETTHTSDANRAFGRKYKDDDYAGYYANKHTGGFGRRLSNRLELSMINRAMRRIERTSRLESALDCPSGTGRLLPVLARLGVSVVAMDTSGSMLDQGRAFHSLFARRPVPVVGSAFEIPLPDRSVDVVLCSRLIHHFTDVESRVRILNELARVARVGVVVSFFDATSFRAWRRVRKARRKGRTSGRCSITRSECVAEAGQAGLTLLGMNALFRYHTEVTAAAFSVRSRA
jgi:SAM-dependent methyltransferase